MSLLVETDGPFLTWVGASEGQEFAATVNNFINELRELGPLDSRGMAAL